MDLVRRGSGTGRDLDTFNFGSNSEPAREIVPTLHEIMHEFARMCQQPRNRVACVRYCQAAHRSPTPIRGAIVSASARRREIFHRVLADGYVDAKTLSTALGVDSSTIRRDLDALAREGKVERTHGGAKAVDGVSFEVPYVLKKDVRRAEKTAIAESAAALVADGDSVVLDSGSTTYEVAVALRHRSSLTVLTNDLRIAKFVATFPDVRLLVSGGELLGSVYTLIGDHAVAFMSQYSARWAFLGADAIDPTAGITNTNTLEVPVKRALIAAAASTVVVADHSKFGHRTLARIATIDEVDRIITDSGLPEDLRGGYHGKLVVTEVPNGS